MSAEGANASRVDTPKSAVELDESRWPILIITFTAMQSDEFKGEKGDAHAHRLNEAMKSIFARQQPFGLILDFSRSQSVSSSFRRILAEFEHEQVENFTRYVAADALVLSSALQRGAYTAYMWIAPIPYPAKAFEKRADAVEWVETKLAQL